MPPQTALNQEVAIDHAATPRLRLEPQSKLTTSPLLTNGIQEPRNRLLFRQARAVKVLAYNERKLVFAHAVLADDAVQGGRGLGVLCGCAIALAGRRAGGLGAAGCESCWGAEADALGEDEAGVIG